MAYNPRDFYFKKAKERHFAARSVFKLEEIDQRFRLFRPGYKVLDLGAAPGSWTQYVQQKTGEQGYTIGIDLAKIRLALPRVAFVQGDAFDEAVVSEAASEAGIAQFDVVISDMAPKTTGIRVTDQQRSFELCKRAMDVAQARLRRGGHFVVKLFQSESFEEFLALVKPLFEKIEILRPKSTRKASFEIYIIGLRRK